MAYRILKYHEEKDDTRKQETHRQLNKEAWTAFVKKQKDESKDDKDFVEKMNKSFAKDDMNLMDVPALKRQALTYHNVHDACKAKSREETSKCRRKLYEVKG